MMVLLTTLPIKEAQWTRTISRILSGTKQRSLFINQERAWSLHKLVKKDNPHLWQLSAESRASFTFMCPYDHLCNGRAGVRISENKSDLVLEFKGSHDKNSHCLRSTSANRCAPGVGGFKSHMSDNGESDDSAKYDVFESMRSAIPYSPVLQELRKKGSAKCHYRLNLNGISDSDSNSDTSPEPLRKKNRVFSGPAYVDPSSMHQW